MTIDAIKEFFARYEERVNQAISDPPKIDVEATVSAYTDCFMEAHPASVICFQNNEDFRTAVPELFASQRKLGAKSMKIGQLTTSTLYDFHVLANVLWNTYYETKDGRQVTVDFSEIYLLQLIDDLPKIFAYIAGNQEKLLKDKGITDS